jgi:hypothetical protein
MYYEVTNMRMNTNTAKQQTERQRHRQNNMVPMSEGNRISVQ